LKIVLLELIFKSIEMIWEENWKFIIIDVDGNRIISRDSRVRLLSTFNVFFQAITLNFMKTLVHSAYKLTNTWL